MHLNRHTDLALRLLMALSTMNRRMTVEEIANRYGVSRHHMAKVAHHLQALGLVRATRGRGGGIALARPATEINVGAVVREMEKLQTFVECMQPDSNTCPVAGACGLQGALARALQDFLRRLDQYHLSDLTPDPQSFAAHLARSTAGTEVRSHPV